MDRQKYLDAYLERIEKEIQEPNRTYIKDFLAVSKAQGFGVGNILEKARHMYRIALTNPKDFREWQEKDVISAINVYLESRAFLRSMGKAIVEVEKPYSHNTIVFAKMVIRSFFKWLYGTRDYPPCVRSLRCRPIRGVKVSETDILTLEEVKTMADACKNHRDKAFIWCLYESGSRRRELHQLRKQDIKFDDNGATLTLQSEKVENMGNRYPGTRTVRVNRGAYDLAMWLNSLGNKDPNSFVWIGQGRTNNGRHLSIETLSWIVRKAAKASGIQKKVWLHLFRHSRATELASKVSDEALKKYFGWSRRSEMPGHYSHLSEREVDKIVLESVYGINRNQADSEPATCCPSGNLRNINAQNSDFRRGFGLPLARPLVKKALERKEATDYLLDLAKEYPDFTDMILEIIQKERAKNSL